MLDDGPYIKSAQVFANTGHFVYNGWATAMLGWQILAAAPFIKIFGFSFFIVRLSTVLITAVTCFLLHRAMVRCGITEWNASIATLTLMLSPVCFPLIPSFMSDCWGLFAIVICLYACLRALQAKTDHAAALWICFASLGNALTGTVRQIAWLGVLVMVPCVLWLMRRRRKVFAIEIVACAVGYAAVFISLHWYSKQLYSLYYGFSYPAGSTALFFHHRSYFMRPLLEIPMLMLPILLMFLPAAWRSSRRSLAIFYAGAFALIALILSTLKKGLLTDFLAPFSIARGSVFSKYGWYMVWPIQGEMPQVIPNSVRLLIAVATILGVLACIASFMYVRSNRTTADTPIAVSSLREISWMELLTLALPFSLAYCVFLWPGAVINLLLDRYLIPLVMIGLILLLRYYQEHIQLKLPVWSFIIMLAIATYSVTAMHDVFAMYRSVLTAVDEVRATGLPRDEIDGGWEYDSWTQIEEGGYTHTPQTREKVGFAHMSPVADEPCRIFNGVFFPQLHSIYSLSFSANDCGGATNFAPVTLKRWLPPNTLNIYVVHNASDQRQRSLAPPSE